MYNHFVTAFYIFGFLKRNRGRSIEISMLILFSKVKSLYTKWYSDS